MGAKGTDPTPGFGLKHSSPISPAFERPWIESLFLPTVNGSLLVSLPFERKLDQPCDEVRVRQTRGLP
jgi:hypothetical protein